MIIRNSLSSAASHIALSVGELFLWKPTLTALRRNTDNCILWIFTISSLFMFSRSRNPLLTFLLSYDVWVTSIIKVNFRFERYWWFCLMNFWNFHTIRVFEVREYITDISTELPCLGDLENPGWLPVQHVMVMVIVSYRFWKFLHHLCFWGKRIIWWHSYWATMGPFNYYVTLFLANFDPPLSQSVTLVRNPPRNVTLVCRPGLKPFMLKKEHIITSKILIIY